MNSSKSKKGVELFPYPQTVSALASAMSKQQIKNQVKLSRTRRSIARLGWAILGSYLLILAAFFGVTFSDWEQKRLIHACHVAGSAEACAEIKQRAGARP